MFLGAAVEGSFSEVLMAATATVTATVAVAGAVAETETAMAAVTVVVASYQLQWCRGQEIRRRKTNDDKDFLSPTLAVEISYYYKLHYMALAADRHGVSTIVHRWDPADYRAVPGPYPGSRASREKGDWHIQEGSRGGGVAQVPVHLCATKISILSPCSNAREIYSSACSSAAALADPGYYYG